MSRLDKQFADDRATALRHPLTRANTLVDPQIRLQNGISIGLSVNK